MASGAAVKCISLALAALLLGHAAHADSFSSPPPVHEIPSVVIDGNGHLILGYQNVPPIDAGQVVGAQGPAGTSIPLGSASHFGRTPAGSPASLALGLMQAGSQSYTISMPGTPGSAAPAANDLCLVGLAVGSSLPAGVSISRCDVFSANSVNITIAATIALTALTTKTILLNLYWMG